jgi:hypothetical protein
LKDASGLGTAGGGASWKAVAFPEAAHTDETKRNNLQTPRIPALSRKKYGQAPFSSLEFWPSLAAIGG